MKEYLVTFKPLEPYFFGSDKTFSFSDKINGRYFISSESVPSQSTLLGAIRYMLLPVKKSDWNYNADDIKKNAQTVGSAGFNPLEKDPDFGKIAGISPAFIVGDKGVMVRTPFDHIASQAQYTPYSDYLSVDMPDGRQKRYTKQYDSKLGGTQGSYMYVKTGEIVPAEKMFVSDLRVGINRAGEEGGFFKKEYKLLSGGYCFAVYLKLNDDVTPQGGIVHLGQGKSTFLVSYTEQKNTLKDDVARLLREDVVYCLGDAFISSEVYSNTSFAITSLKTYRHFQNTKNNVLKGDKLFNIIEAGSVFIPYDKSAFLSSVRNTPVRQSGYNFFVTHKEEE